MAFDDLKPSSAPDGDALDRWLRTHAPLAPLPDDNFSAGVLANLPPPARRPGARRAWFCIAGLAVGAGIALAGAGFTASGSVTLSAFNAQLVGAIEQLLTPAASGGLALTMASLWYAFRDRWRPAWTKWF
jgi:hypothetical protein